MRREAFLNPDRRDSGSLFRTSCQEFRFERTHPCSWNHLLRACPLPPPPQDYTDAGDMPAFPRASPEATVPAPGTRNRYFSRLHNGHCPRHRSHGDKQRGQTSGFMEHARFEGRQSDKGAKYSTEKCLKVVTALQKNTAEKGVVSLGGHFLA